MFRAEIFEERAAEKRAAPARHPRPFAVGAVEPLEGFRLIGTRVELPDYSNHERPPAGCSAVYQGFAAPRSLTVGAHVLRRSQRRSEGAKHPAFSESCRAHPLARSNKFAGARRCRTADTGAPDFRRLAISDRDPEASSIVLAFGGKGAHHPLAPIISDPVLEQEIMGSIR